MEPRARGPRNLVSKMAGFCWVSSLRKGTEVHRLEAKDRGRVDMGDVGAWECGSVGAWRRDKPARD